MTSAEGFDKIGASEESAGRRCERPRHGTKGVAIVRTNDIASPIVNQSPTPLQRQRVELAAQIIHRRTTIIGDRWDRLHPTQQSWYRDMARELLKDVDALMNGGA